MMLTRSRQDTTGKESKSRKVIKINRSTKCKDSFGIDEIVFFCDICRPYFDINRQRKKEKMQKGNNPTKNVSSYRKLIMHTIISILGPCNTRRFVKI